jgi:hypothetical protein
MAENAQSGLKSPPILAESEAGRRMLLLTELQAALAECQMRSVLARNHRLVLRYNQHPCAPSGLTNPQLHIFGADWTDTATTDGTIYRLASGPEYPAADPPAAAAAIQHDHQPATRA